MKTVVLKLTDDEYQALLREASKEGYALLSEYVRAKLFEKRTQEFDTTKLERKIQDLINPFTAKIDELAKRIAQLQETLQSAGKSMEESDTGEKREPEKRTIKDIVRERGFTVRNENTLRNSKAFKDRAREYGLKVISTKKGNLILVDPEYYKKFQERLSSISVNSVEKAIDLLGEFGQLFRVLVEDGIIYYDNDQRKWILTL
ncbi:hypothetical protein HS7_17060 [Sulfolobales archaeon HS-7]|nr:hypothetical protein HS7_17060 [Sulfolobales archaeon HS-7]